MIILIEIESETEKGNKIVIDTDETTDPHLFIGSYNLKTNQSNITMLTSLQIIKLVSTLQDWLVK
jgi:hypothetical protein